MSKGPENRFITSVHRLLPPVDEAYRMKNHNEYNGGIADVWYSGKVADLWVEYKFIAVPKRATTMIDLCDTKKDLLTALQQEWLSGRHKEGRNVAVIVGCEAGGVILPDLAWKQPLSTGDFVSRITTRKSIADWIMQRVYG